jgi:O-antigen/teichoic acid export membrane protein
VLFFFGSAYLPAVGPMRLLLVASVFSGMITLLLVGLRAINYPIAGGWAGIASLIVITGLLVYLLPRFGLYGAALAALSAYIARFAVLLAIIRRLLKLSLADLFPRPADLLAILVLFGRSATPLWNRITGGRP